MCKETKNNIKRIIIMML